MIKLIIVFLAKLEKNQMRMEVPVILVHMIDANIVLHKIIVLHVRVDILPILKELLVFIVKNLEHYVSTVIKTINVKYVERLLMGKNINQLLIKLNVLLVMFPVDNANIAI